MPERSEWIVSGPGVRVRVSEDYIDLEDHRVPTQLEIETASHGEPTVYARVAVSARGPRLLDLRFSVDEDPFARGIRQTDLRNIQVSEFLEDLVAGWMFPITRGPDGVAVRPANYPGSSPYTEALRFAERLRSGRTSRNITPQLLEHVAQIYRDNMNTYPTKAVQHHFQVSQRMAAEYVSRARKRGLLPPTKRGKKNA